MNVLPTLSILSALMALPVAAVPAHSADLSTETCTVVVNARRAPGFSTQAGWFSESTGERFFEPVPSRSFRLRGTMFTLEASLPEPEAFGPSTYAALDFREMEEAGQVPSHWGLSLRFSFGS